MGAFSFLPPKHHTMPISPLHQSIVQASFYWRSNKPDGFGFTFAAPDFTPKQIQEIFFGAEAKRYMRNTDDALGSGIVNEYLQQLDVLGKMRMQQRHVPLQLAIMAALNIIWLTERGFLPQDEYNGFQFIGAMQ
jgi:hypothetical protein